jgi:hypothetical protein
LRAAAMAIVTLRQVHLLEHRLELWILAQVVKK